MGFAVSDDVELAVTVAAFFLSAAGIFLARRKAMQPAEPLKTRLLNYNLVTFVAIVVTLLIAAHLMTLLSGHRFGGRNAPAGLSQTEIVQPSLEA